MFIITFNILIFIIYLCQQYMRIIQSLKLFNSRIVFSFCKNKDIAIVSSKVISMIQNQQKKDSKCLGLKISQLTVRDFPEKYSIRPQNLDIVKQMFTTGVKLPQFYQKQGRIKDAFKEAQGSNNKSRSLFVFYPTWITTTHVFKYMSKKTTLSLFTGDRGVGKTASFILYSILMNNIIKYVMSNKEATMELIQDGIIKSPEKVIYWSFQKTIQQGIIVNQCQQMISNNENPQKYKEYLMGLQKKDLSDLSEQISRFYNLDGLIKRVIIIDQINALAALYRQHNTKINNNQFKSKQEQLSSKMKLNKYNQNRDEISSIGNYTIYNSSINIQKSLISRQDKIENEVSMILDPHTTLYYPQLEYPLRISQEKAKSQTLHYIGMEYKRYFSNFTEFQIQEKMKQWKIPQIKGSAYQSSENEQFTQNNQRQKLLNKQIQKIKNYIQPDIQFALTLLFVRVNLNIQYQPIAFKERIKEYYRIKQKQFKYFIQKIKKINRNQQLRITQILFLLNAYVFQLQKKKKMITINRKELFLQMRKKFSEIKEERQIDQYMEQSIFPYSNLTKQYICLIPGHIMEKLLKQLLVNLLQQDFDYCLQRFQLDQLKNGSVTGSLLENFITKATEQCEKKKGYFIMQNILTQIKATGKFYDLNLPDQEIAELYLMDHMIQMIQMAKKNQNNFCLGLPYYKKQPQKRSYTSYGADYCLIKYTPNQSQPYEFIFVDIKTGNNIRFTDLNEKAKIFKERFKLSLKYVNIKFSVKMIILCKKQWENPKGIQQHIEVVDIKKNRFIVLQQSFEQTAVRQMLKKIKEI